MQFPNGYSGGTVEGKITLSVQDKGFKIKWNVQIKIRQIGEEVKTAEVNFKVNVNPVADDATVKVGQPVGYEDAGRVKVEIHKDISMSLKLQILKKV